MGAKRVPNSSQITEQIQEIELKIKEQDQIILYAELEKENLVAERDRMRHLCNHSVVIRTFEIKSNDKGVLGNCTICGKPL